MEPLEVEDEGALGPPARPRRHISVLSAFMMLTTWSTSSSNVLYPFCFGVLGMIGGPVLMLTAFWLNWTVTRWTVNAALITGADTFGGLGFHVLGERGRMLFEGSQVLFQQLFLPVAIVLCADAVQSLLGAKDDRASFASCNGNVVVLFAVVAFVLIQVSRELENVTAIAYVSCALMLAMTVALAEEALTRPPPRSITTVGAAELFVGMGDHTVRYQWANILNAIGIFIYSCLPSCIVVETMAALKPEDRPRMKHAVDASFIAYISIYCVAGLPAVWRWGGDIPEPIELENSAPGVLVKLVLICGTLLDFVLASTTVNRAVIARLQPGFDYRWTRRNALVWARYSLPSSIIAVGMALFVPRLESLTGLLNSIAGATLQITALPVCLWWTANPDAVAMARQLGSVRLSGAIVYGTAFTVAIFVAACYNMGTTRYTAQGNETFWCDLAG